MAFFFREGAQKNADAVPECVDCAHSSLLQEDFEFGEEGWKGCHPPVRSVEHRNFCTYSRKSAPFMGPSTTMEAVTALQRNTTTKVVNFQCPCDTEAAQRCPHGERSRRRVMRVVAHVSSRNTNLLLPYSAARAATCYALASRLRALARWRAVFFLSLGPIC